MHGNPDYNFIKKVGDLSGDGVVVYDLNNRQFLYANPVFLNIFRLEESDLLARPELVLQNIAPEDAAYVRSRFLELVKRRPLDTVEFRIKLPGGIIKYLNCDIIMLQDPRMVTAFVKDVSKSKHHEDYLIKYTAQKDIMLDMLTHNLSGPLHLSKDVIDSLRRGYEKNNVEDVSRLISIMQENTRQCIELVNDFLKEEHYESSFTYVRKTRFDVIDKVNVMLTKLKEINREKTFTLTTDHPSLSITSDAVKFFQIIHNVLSNSIKFTAPDGKIDIRVKDYRDCYEIRIKDNGIGIPDSIKPTIFKNRIQGRLGLNGEKSKGMGLSIASRLTEIMNGKIWFESEENKGSRFYIRLPKD